MFRLIEVPDEDGAFVVLARYVGAIVGAHVVLALSPLGGVTVSAVNELDALLPMPWNAALLGGATCDAPANMTTMTVRYVKRARPVRRRDRRPSVHGLCSRNRLSPVRRFDDRLGAAINPIGGRRDHLSACRATFRVVVGRRRPAGGRHGGGGHPVVLPSSGSCEAAGGRS